MAEPFKNNFNVPVIRAMARHLGRVAPDFDAPSFIATASEGLERLELKQRADRITTALIHHLPEDFPSAADILIASLDPDCGQTNSDMQTGPVDRGIRGWPILPMAEFIALRGQNHVALALDTLKDMTSRFSSEFAVRPFLANHPEQTLETFARWTTDKNEHVRRLVSEGSRPRLPWGMRLHTFVDDPSPVIRLLEMLKDDPSEYVRRSVANNLNDIAKDHPDRVALLAQDWMIDASPDRQRLVRHGLRTLIKSGHAYALQALGFAPALITVESFSLSTPRIALGEALSFDIAIASTSSEPQPLVIDYAVHHMRANGRTTAKVFKWKTASINPGAVLHTTKRHPIKPITTRRYYPGRHRIEVLINGQCVAEADFELVVP
ncbi:hypothetical protein [Magnetovibrio sp.]|uniref:hypothetical protein n=1 Tax=Magnetovibrio sp. TaxID=2024836 RepID=UPI002F9340B2